MLEYRDEFFSEIFATSMSGPLSAERENIGQGPSSGSRESRDWEVEEKKRIESEKARIENEIAHTSELNVNLATECARRQAKQDSLDDEIARNY